MDMIVQQGNNITTSGVREVSGSYTATIILQTTIIKCYTLLDHCDLPITNLSTNVPYSMKKPTTMNHLTTLNQQATDVWAQIWSSGVSITNGRW